MNRQSVMDDLSGSSSNQELASACGLYCGACGIFLATQENDSEKILQYAIVLNQTFEETFCDGCGAKRKSLHCSKICIFIRCKQQKGVDYCGDCEEFPCKAFRELTSKMPHHIEIIASVTRLKEIGIKNWLLEMKEYFSCPHCKTINSAYHLNCRKCGEMPGSKFISQHKDLIEQYLSE